MAANPKLPAGMRWEQPPPKTNHRTGMKTQRWVNLLEPLMARPRKWALILEDVSASAITHLRKRTVLIPDGEWEFRVVLHDKSKSNRCRLYAHYLGPDE